MADLYITVNHGAYHRTESRGDSVVIVYDDLGRVIAVEILDAVAISVDGIICMTTGPNDDTDDDEHGYARPGKSPGRPPEL